MIHRHRAGRLSGIALGARRLSGIALALMAALWLSACGTDTAVFAPDGRIDILGGDSIRALAMTPEKRRALGFFDTGLDSLAVPSDPAGLAIRTPPGDVVLGRVIRTPLAVTRYLTWYWRLNQATPAAQASALDNPVRLVVGFNGGKGHSGKDHPGDALPSDRFPPFDRALVIVWNPGDLHGGEIIVRGAHGRFVAQTEAADGRWWRHAADLYDLHHRAWPAIEPHDVSVAFVAIAVARSGAPGEAEISTLILSR